MIRLSLFETDNSTTLVSIDNLGLVGRLPYKKLISHDLAITYIYMMFYHRIGVINNC